MYCINFSILALGSGQRLLYRLESGLGLVLVLRFYMCPADFCDSGLESIKRVDKQTDRQPNLATHLQVKLVFVQTLVDGAVACLGIWTERFSVITTCKEQLTIFVVVISL